MLFCDPLTAALHERWPEEWGCCFAIKPLYGYADFGIMLVEHNVDRFSGAVLRGRDDVMRFLRTQGRAAAASADGASRRSSDRRRRSTGGTRRRPTSNL